MGGKPKSEYKQFAREIVLRVQKFPAKAASGVVVADLMEAALMAGAVTPSLLSHVALLLEDLPLSAWLVGKGGGGGARGAGASVSRVLASLLTVQNRVLRKYPRSRRMVAIAQDQVCCSVLQRVALCCRVL